MDHLVERATTGDRQAMAELVRGHYGSVYRFCARRVGAEAAKDAAQETFLAAWRSIRRFQGDSSFQVWLLGIANNVCRRKQRSPAPPCPEGLWRVSSGPEESWIDRRALIDALHSLSPEHLEAVLLHEVEGLTYDEAAQVVGVPVGTMKSRLHHAFQRLRSLLQSQGVSR
ncbi:MAG: sigma-70 family RNA polymerase sigma factor [Fimbriimonadales bacterium]